MPLISSDTQFFNDERPYMRRVDVNEDLTKEYKEALARTRQAIAVQRAAEFNRSRQTGRAVAELQKALQEHAVCRSPILSGAVEVIPSCPLSPRTRCARRFFSPSISLIIFDTRRDSRPLLRGPSSSRASSRADAQRSRLSITRVLAAREWQPRFDRRTWTSCTNSP